MTPREELADLLQRARVEAGYGSQGALAKRLNVSRPVISKAESASQPPPSEAILAAWAGATGAPLDRLNELAERARSGVPDWFVPWLAPESNATLLRYWSPFIVPGIAQTKAYMHALFEDEGHLLDHADEMASARLQVGRERPSAGWTTRANPPPVLTTFAAMRGPENAGRAVL
jgi:transcriptional regulator with XRE-family HTH domain